MPAFELVASQRPGHNKLCMDGFTYNRQRVGEQGQEYWLCERRRECKARMVVHGDTVIKDPTTHSHAGDPGRIHLLKASARLRHLAKNTQNVTHDIVTTVKATIPLESVGNVRCDETLKRTVRYHRDPGYAPLPADLASLQLPDEFTKTTRDELFLLHDEGADAGNNRFLMFATEKNLRLLSQSPHWFVDGTFDTVPEHFEQLYTIHCMMFGITVPLVYVLLPKKTRAIYDRMLEVLKEKAPAPAPTSIMMDFEQACINSFRAAFPTADLHGCFFHLCQSVHRNLKDDSHPPRGLQGLYRSDPHFQLCAKMVMALAFIPEDEVYQAFQALVDYVPDELLPTTRYFEEYYVGRHRNQGGGGVRVQPRFPTAFWNVVQRVKNDLPRSNNRAEGWHHRFSSAIACHHANLWKFLNTVKKEQASFEVDIELLFAGRRPARKRVYLDYDARLKNCVDAYVPVDGDVIQYLRGIAHNIDI